MNNYKKFLVFISFSLITFFVLVLVILTSISENPISLRYSFFQNKEIKYLVPQGWAFFSKSPRDEEIYIYELTNQKISNVKINNVKINQFFGINRENRLINAKLSSVIAEIEPGLWYDFRGDANLFLQTAKNHKFLSKISLKTKKPSLCGTYFIEVKEPLPWAWLSIERKISMNSKLIIIEFKCY